MPRQVLDLPTAMLRWYMASSFVTKLIVLIGSALLVLCLITIFSPETGAWVAIRVIDSYMQHIICIGGLQNWPVSIPWILGNVGVGVTYLWLIPSRWNAAQRRARLAGMAQPPQMVGWFNAFIRSCGIGHLWAAANLWLGLYGMEAMWCFLLTFPISMYTAFKLPALVTEGQDRLLEENRRLRARIAELEASA